MCPHPGVSSTCRGARVYNVWCVCGAVQGRVCVSVLCLLSGGLASVCVCEVRLRQSGVGLCVFVGVLVVHIWVCVACHVCIEVLPSVICLHICVVLVV